LLQPQMWLCGNLLTMALSKLQAADLRTTASTAS
jgi:hypothetical protein